MIRARMIWLPLLGVLAACAADGGPVGSGISSSVSGNVVTVQTGSLDDSVAPPSVRVTIDEAPGVEDVTDADGNFALTGNFAGAITLRFAAASVTATQQLDVPAGSTTLLEDLVISPQMVQANAIRLLAFFGSVALVDCDGGEILVNDRHPTANQFMVRLSAETVLVNGRGQALLCNDIHPHDVIAVQGVIRPDHTVIAVTITVAPKESGEPGPLHELRFAGDVLVLNCDTGMLLIDDATTGQSRLRLSSASMLVDANQRPLRCGNIAVGDHVSGRGTILVRQPGVIDVLTMMVKRP